jgi:hypothetical protein
MPRGGSRGGYEGYRPALHSFRALDDTSSENESSDEEPDTPFAAPFQRPEDPEPKMLFAPSFTCLENPEPETPFVAPFTCLEDPPQYDWMSTCLASFMLAQRMCMLRYLIDQIWLLQRTLRVQVDMVAVTPDLNGAAALEEPHETMLKQKGGSKGRVPDVLCQFWRNSEARFSVGLRRRL